MGRPQSGPGSPTNPEPPEEKLWTGKLERNDAILLIQQGLRNCGFADFAERLAKESGLREAEYQVKFKDAVIEGDWETALSLVPAICKHDHVCDQIVYEIMQKRFLEEIARGDVRAALVTLRQELDALKMYPEHTKQLATLLFFPAEDNDEMTDASQIAKETTLSDWMARLGWDKVTNEYVLETIIELIASVPQHNSEVLIHPQRLENLVARAQRYSSAAAVGHNTDDSNISLLRPYKVGLEQLPVQLHERLEPHTDEIWLLVFSNSGDYLVSASKDRTAVVHTIGKNGEVLDSKSLGPHNDAVANVSWRQDDEYLLTCSEYEARIWAVAGGKFEFQKTVKSHQQGYISSCTWLNTPVSSFLTAGNDKTIVQCFWEKSQQTKWLMKDRVSDLLTACDGRIIIAVVGDQYIDFMRVTDHIPVASIRAKSHQASEGSSITSINLTPDNEFLVSNTKDHTCHMWKIGPLLRKILQGKKHEDITTGYGLPNEVDPEIVNIAPIMEFKPPTISEGKYVLRSSVGGKNTAFLACGSESGHIYIWHLATGRFLAELEAHPSTVNCVAWNPKHPHMLASASDDKTIGIWLSPHSQGRFDFIAPAESSPEDDELLLRYLARQSTLLRRTPTNAALKESYCTPTPIHERL